MMSIQEAIIAADLLGSPVNLTYKGRSKFKTFCGGCTTIILFLIITGYMIDMINVLFNEPIYNSFEVTDVIPYQSNDESFHVDTGSTMLAVQLFYKDFTTIMPQSEINRNYRVQFLQQTREKTEESGEVTKQTYVQAVYCEDFYRE